MNQYLVYKGRVMARLVQPTALKEVFASSHWTWDDIAGHNVLIKRMSCKVSSSRKWHDAAVVYGNTPVAYPLPGGVAWEFLVTTA